MLTVFRAMARYNRWMNERLYACCEKLSDQERKLDRGAFFRSIHGTFNHLLFAKQQFFNDQTHHRGQVTTLLMQAGIDPGVTDLLWLPGMEETGQRP